MTPAGSTSYLPNRLLLTETFLLTQPALAPAASVEALLGLGHAMSKGIVRRCACLPKLLMAIELVQERPAAKILCLECDGRLKLAHRPASSKLWPY